MHLARLQEDYRLGDIRSITESFEGVVNHNYIIEASSGKYLLKQFRYKTIEALPEIALAEQLMHERGIPAICMIPAHSGSTFVIYDDAPYALYPFVESDCSHQYSLADYHAMGVMLARLHRAGSKDIPDTLLQRTFPDAVITRTDAERFEHAMHKYIKQIKMRNLFFDARTRDIIGICDWEHTNYWSRAYELVRSYLYICFPEHYDDSAFPIAESFMSGYQSVYPIAQEEISSALQVRLRDMVTKTWLEKKHFKHGDTRSDHLIGHELRLINDFVVGDIREKLAL